LLLERQHTERALITAKRQAEEAAALAKQALAQAQAADRAKTKFLANMTHELRTPLNAIIGFSELIRNSRQQTGEHPAYAQYIFESGTQLLGILNGVLDLARIEAGKMELEEQAIAVYEVLGAAACAVEPMCQRKSIKISNRVGADHVALVDANKMKQVFVNLLSNAVKFAPQSGWVEAESEIAPGGELIVSIRDNGCGIPAQHLEKVLEPFGQVEDHLTRSADGVGLGLPIARALVGLHGGELGIISELGVGTTVEVRLPTERVRQISPSIHQFRDSAA
jgi:two-component system cell cycle sensor histidine kinase PleC